MHRILFVCTANTCRSPLAEWLFRQLAEQRGVAVEVQSAGIFAAPGAQMSAYSAKILHDREIEHTFASQRVDDERMAWADFVFTMTYSHKHELLLRYPHLADKVYTLKEYVISTEVQAVLQEIDRIYAEIEMQFSFGQAVRDDQRTRLHELEQSLPNLDISDPFSGSLELYQHCALDIESHLHKVLDKLQSIAND